MSAVAGRRARPHVGLHHAVKCNPEPALLARLAALGAGFEIASLAELETLVALGVDPRRVLYSNPVKHAAQIAGAWRIGVDRFAADSRCELAKLAEHAPRQRHARDARPRHPARAARHRRWPARALHRARPAARGVRARHRARSGSFRIRSWRSPRFNGFEIPSIHVIG